MREHERVLEIQEVPDNRAPQLDRRVFLAGAAAAMGGAVFPSTAPAAPAREESGLVDVNVNLGRWPLRRLPHDQTELLASTLRSHGVTQAWAGSFDGLLHKDIAAVNARLADECQRHGAGLLVPFGSVNPKLPDWEEDLRRCVQIHRMRGIRLHPNYHGYQLDDPVFARLLALAAKNDLVVQVALVMEDERMMHPLLRVEPVATEPLAGLIKGIPGLRLTLLNALRTLRGDALGKLVAAGDVYVEISMIEGVGAVGCLLDLLPADRVLFGSHAPLFYFEAAKMKLEESPLKPEVLRAIRHQNAKRLLA
ncbi:MAG: amidohydrolase family protein [Pirellulales bacterium]|nr:amidohydrolase family protein [Pirellulales bacterium]